MKIKVHLAPSTEYGCDYHVKTFKKILFQKAKERQPSIPANGIWHENVQTWSENQYRENPMDPYLGISKYFSFYQQTMIFGVRILDLNDFCSSNYIKVHGTLNKGGISQENWISKNGYWPESLPPFSPKKCFHDNKGVTHNNPERSETIAPQLWLRTSVTMGTLVNSYFCN